MNSSSKSLDIPRRNTRNGNSPILRSINRVLLSQLIHLLRRKSSISEHANLAGDMAPVVLRSQSLEFLLQECAHGDDTVGHALDFAEPLLVQSLVVEDLGRDAGTVDGWVGVERADEDLDLGVDALGFGGVGGDDGEGAYTLSVETLFAVSKIAHVTMTEWSVPCS